MDRQGALKEITFIKKVIEESRNSIIYHASYLFWGVAITIALITTYVLINYQAFSIIPWIWIVAVLAGWVYSGYAISHGVNKKRVKTFVEKLTGSVWLAVGITATLVSWTGVFSNAFDGVFLSPLISSIIGIAYFVTGVAHNKNWFRNLAYGWWIGAFFLFLFPSDYSTLIMAGMIVGLQIVPALILRKELKQVRS
jgi:hypothetical protein